MADDRTLRMDAFITSVGSVALLVAGLDIVVIPTRHAPTELAPWVLALMFFATGSFVANMPLGRQVHVFQLDDVPRLIGFFFVSPATLIACRLLGALPALALVRRQTGRKLVFNLANFGLEVGVGVGVFALLDPVPGRLSPSVWPAAFLATIAADAVSTLTVGIIIGLAEGRLDRSLLTGPSRIAIATSLLASTIGLIAVTTLWSSLTAGWLLVLLVGLSIAGHRAFTLLQSRSAEQARLHDFLVHLSPVTPTDERVSELLDHVQRLFQVEQVTLTLSRGSDGFLLRSEAPNAPPIQDEDRLEQLRQLSAVAGAWAASPALMSPLRRRLAARGIGGQQERVSGPDALAVPLAIGGEIVGGLSLAGPFGDLRQFTVEDAKLLTSVAAQLGHAFERGEQAAELERTARSDPLTGLANLAEFFRLADTLLADSRSVAVLLVGISQLRTVNDVFGRSAGDQLLVELAARLMATSPPGSIVARVGGHQFALACPTASGSSVPALARRLRSSLEDPVIITGVHAQVGAHVGVSRAPTHGTTPQLLLQRAEAAADVARHDAFGVAVFTPDLDRDVQRPWQLVSNLRHELGAGASTRLWLAYQPKICLVTGDVLGLEALIRWSHPDLGEISPGEFIPLAESSGLVSKLTTWVLDQALADCLRWQQWGLAASVSVNLSARSLLDVGLVPGVAAAVERSGLRPSDLTLELTESSVMDQPGRSLLVLDALRELGIRLSIDDFGTGYSSLAYLQGLPVDEVKLDRTFLRPETGLAPLARRTATSPEFLRHAVALAHTADLHVVVEGVEDQDTLELLRSVGADAAQGFHLCRPLSLDRLLEWLEVSSLRLGR